MLSYDLINTKYTLNNWVIMGHPGNFRGNLEKSVKNIRTHGNYPISQEIM